MVEPKPNQPKRVITWDEYWRGVRNLKKQLDAVDWIDDHTIFFGIPRGGTILSTLLVYHLNRKTEIGIAAVAHNDLIALHEVHEVIYGTGKGKISIKPSTFVLIDDIIDSGQTIDVWTKALRDDIFLEKDASIKTIAMCVRHSCPIKPDIFYSLVTDGCWLVFPYES